MLEIIGLTFLVIGLVCSFITFILMLLAPITVSLLLPIIFVLIGLGGIGALMMLFGGKKGK